MPSSQQESAVLPARPSLAEPSGRFCDDQRAWAADGHYHLRHPSESAPFGTLRIAVFPARNEKRTKAGDDHRGDHTLMATICVQFTMPLEVDFLVL